MLRRVLPAAICALLLSTSCKRSIDSALVGYWRCGVMNADGLLEIAGEARFASNHTFTEHEWDTTNSRSNVGNWHVRGDKLVLDVRGEADLQNAKHLEFSLAMHDQDHFTLRQTDGAESKFERIN